MAIVGAALSVSRPAAAIAYFTGPTEIAVGQDWTNYLRLADIDGDGDLDLVVPSCGGFFQTPVAEPFRLYDNDGGVFTESTAARLGAAVDLAVRVVAVGDIDGDGDLDMFLPNAGGGLDRLYVNDGDGVFSDEAATRLPAGANASRSGGARFGDLDGDGDLDLLVAQGYTGSDSPAAWLLLNDGDGVFTNATAGLPQTFPGSDPDDVDLLDVDRDFDLDVLINAHSGPSALWRNDGAGAFTDISGNMPGPAGGPFHYGPSACDVDGDGDLDIIVDNIGAAVRREQLLINDGGGLFSDGTAALGANADADDNGVMCVDVDDDGDFDLAIPSLSANERVLKNDGGSFTLEPGAFPTVGDPTLWMDLGDVDGDGRVDAVTGQGESGPASNHVSRVYLGSSNMPIDATPPAILAYESPDGADESAPFALRLAVSDRVVTDSGPRVRVYASLDASEIEGTFIGGDLFRVVLPAATDGPVEVALCAMDGQGNESCTQSFVYGDGSTGPGPGSGGNSGVGGAGAMSSGAGANPGGGGDGFEVDDGGCGCLVAGDKRAKKTSALWAALALGFSLRRLRRASERPDAPTR